MIDIKKENLLKATPEYEEYSNNVCNLSIEELKEMGMLKCGGCCNKNEENSGCKDCKKKNCCKK
ncbi:hypothetical protein [Clostridium uliginosum]|uniref:Uncharacterized protein n=1 Tax=Clostridium uliginosum TaxID=119641 RepID=A0A1I1LW72_9CLOT|nr:hypothetical protein [Clostridium uliginosum]SFC77384.1 hypothetical protein SAMN05421842_10961 [Clostridium uliginosum]